MTRIVRPILACSLVLSVACAGGSIRPTTAEKIDPTPTRLARGQYLVGTVAACGGCHTAREKGDLMNPEDADRLLGGGNWLQDGAVGLYVPNLSSDVETGLGGWSDDEILRAIRDGVSKDGHILFPIMPYGQYRHMSDEDARSVVAYLRTVPAVKPATPKRENELPFMPSFMINRGVSLHDPAKDVPEPKKENSVAYGQYVAQLGHCMDCHSMGSMGPRKEDDRPMAGADVPFTFAGVGKVWASNLTSDAETGLGKYSADQLKKAMRSGTRLDGKQMAPPMATLLPHFALMDEGDMDALVTWVKAIPAVKNAIPARQLEPAFAKMIGE